MIWGTRPEQRTVRATLGTLADQDLESQATIVIGAVAGLDLAWFENRPLFGKRVVVTRARAQSSSLLARLRELGADTVEIPAIRIDEPSDGGAALDAAVSRLADPGRGYDCVGVTSPNGARRLLAACRDARSIGAAKVAAIGPGTAAALAEGIIASRNGNAIIVPAPRSIVRRLSGLRRTIIVPTSLTGCPSQREGRAVHDPFDNRLDAIAIGRRAAADRPGGRLAGRPLPDGRDGRCGGRAPGADRGDARPRARRRIRPAARHRRRGARHPCVGR